MPSPQTTIIRLLICMLDATDLPYFSIWVYASLLMDTVAWGVLANNNTFTSRSQARIKEKGWRLGPTGRNNIPSKHIIDNARRKYNASKLVLSDRPCPRPIVPVCEELPQQRPLLFKNKRAKSQYLQVASWLRTLEGRKEGILYLAKYT